MIYEILEDLLIEGLESESTTGANIEEEINEVRLAVEYIFNKSQELVPVDTGKLQESGYSEVITTSTGPQGIVKYSTSYAMAVHELPYNHNIGQSKYLEDAVINYIQKTKTRLSFKIYMDEVQVYILVGSFRTNQSSEGLELNFYGLSKLDAFLSLKNSLSLLSGVV